MSRLTALQRELTEILREEYGAHDVRVVMGTKHPRLEFTYAGVSYSRVVPNGNVADFGRTVKNYAVNLRRDLGEPPVTPARVKRNLEDMMPTINELIDPQERAGLQALSSGGLDLPGPVPKPAERSEVFRGTVSVRRASTDPNWARLRFVIPDNLYRAFAHQGQVRMTMSEPDNFQVVPVQPVRGTHLPVFGSRGRGFYEFSSERVVPMTPGLQFYGNSPAEILLVGGHLLVRVLEKRPYVPKSKPSPAKPTQAMGGIGSLVIKPPEFAEPAPSRAVPPWQQNNQERVVSQIQPSGDDVRACLAALRRIEHLTDYRLVKLKEGEHQRWVFQARID